MSLTDVVALEPMVSYQSVIMGTCVYVCIMMVCSFNVMCYKISYTFSYYWGKAMANYPQELAHDAVCQSHTGHMTGLWFLPARPLRLNTNE